MRASTVDVRASSTGGTRQVAVARAAGGDWSSRVCRRLGWLEGDASRGAGGRCSLRAGQISRRSGGILKRVRKIFLCREERTLTLTTPVSGEELDAEVAVTVEVEREPGTVMRLVTKEVMVERLVDVPSALVEE